MITAVVLTKNEEKNIRDCLKSLQWCDEIVVVDDYSTDETIKIVRKIGETKGYKGKIKVFQRKLAADFAAQRNFALRQAQAEWVLFVDADERVTPSLAKEIRLKILNQVQNDNGKVGFYLKRRDFFGGRWLKHGETAKVKLVRLGRKDAGKWQREVHEVWEIKGPIGKLKNPLLHYPHPTLDEFLKEINFHSTLHAQALRDEGIRPSLFRLIANPLGKFCQNYFWKLGFLDGIQGFIMAMMMSFHSFLARGKLFTLFHSPRRRSTSRPPSEVFGRVLDFLFFAYLAFFPFGQLTGLPIRLIKVPEIHVYLTDILVGLLTGIWGIWRFLLVKKRYKLPPLAKPIFLFSIICLVSLGLASPPLTNRETLVAGLYLIRWMAYAGLYFVIFDLKKHFNQLKPPVSFVVALLRLRRSCGAPAERGHLATDEVKWHSLSRFLIAVGTMVAIFGLIQYVLWPDLKPLETLEWDPHYYRVVSTFLDPGFTGIILVLTLVLIVSRHPEFISSASKKQAPLISGSRFRNRFLTCVRTGFGMTLKKGWLSALSFLVIYLALALTYSRASYLAYIVGMGAIAWVKKRPKLFLGVILIGALTLMVLPQPAGEGGKLSRTYSIEARIENWQHALIIARDHPLFGVGFNAYRYVQRDYGFLEEEKWQVSHSGAGADSSLLFVLATTGVPGLLAYLWIWGKAIREILKQDPDIRQDKVQNDKEGYRVAVWASTAALFTHSFFLNSLFYPWVMAWLWILVAKEYK